mmetsp:Transcript_106896/g.300563  ORF Transcript_106896/g.300563 Transcript_106896/m.300563 type:complete len:342 (+) Transcript_106896:1-1026(+)
MYSNYLKSISLLVILLLCNSTALTKRFTLLAMRDRKDNNVARNFNRVTGNDRAELVEHKDQLNPFQICLCGALATIVGDFAMHPIDTIKVTQQAASTALTFIGAIKQIFATSGVLGFYQGVVPYLIGDGSSGAVKFATFEASKTYLERRLPPKYHPAVQFLCAAGAMLACSVILVPGEVLKCKIQAGGATSLGGAISSILKTEGIKGLFAGYYATLVRDVPYTMLELGVYENVKMLIRRFREREALNGMEEAFAAAVTGGLAAFLTTPLDLIKTKLMLQGTTGGQYSGIFDAVGSIYQRSGLDGLFVGSTARVTWLVPFTIIYLGVYEASKRSMFQANSSK